MISIYSIINIKNNYLQISLDLVELKQELQKELLKYQLTNGKLYFQQQREIKSNKTENNIKE